MIIEQLYAACLQKIVKKEKSIIEKNKKNDEFRKDESRKLAANDSKNKAMKE